MKRSACHVRHRYRPVRGKSNAVEPCHYGIGIGDAFVHSGRAGATEQNLAIRQAFAGLKENTPHVAGFRRYERTRLGVERHDDHQHQSLGIVATEDIQRVFLAEDPAVMQPDHDMR